MLSSAIIAVSYKTASRTPLNFSSLLTFFLLLLVLAPLSVSADGNALEDAARQLAEKIAAIPNLHGPVRLEITDDPNLIAVVDLSWKDMLRKELEKHHLPVTGDNTAQLLHVFVTKTPAQLVFTATARVADKEEVRILAIPRAALALSNPPAAGLRIEKQLLFESSDRIIDVSAQPESTGGIDVLAAKTGELLAFRLDSAGAIKQIIAFPSANVRIGRDFRAELASPEGNSAAVLPGKICEFSWSSASTEVKCRAAKASWRAPTQISSPCAPAKWKLLSGENDWTAADQLHLVADGEAQPEAFAAFSGFPGPILSINAEQNPSSALLVTQNLRTGNYEVYKITLVCGN
jgi:hypothetical protein